VYNELRKLAAARLANEKPGQTLQATALVHEAYLRLVDVDVEKAQDWDSRGHFFAAAAEAMRRILIDRARRKQRPKHGGDRRRVDFDSVFPASDAQPETLLAMDEALVKLEREHAEKSALVQLRYYAGLSLTDAATALGGSPPQPPRDIGLTPGHFCTVSSSTRVNHQSPLFFSNRPEPWALETRIDRWSQIREPHHDQQRQY
jgi:RNA polymerase sigma factor (TIGR02999 family)